MNVVPHRRCESMSSISMDADWPNDVSSPESGPRPGVDSPFGTIPKDIDMVLDPPPMTPSTPCDAKIRLPYRVHSISHVNDNHDGDYPYRNSSPRPSPTFRLPYRHANSDSPFSSFKPSRYSLGVLGDDVRPLSATKPNMTVRKIFVNARTVLPLHCSKSEIKPKLHRRDSFASLPNISDIITSIDDSMDIRTPFG